MPRIKLLQLTQYLEIGGLETLIVDICREIDRSTFDVQVLCLNGYDIAYKRDLAERGIGVSLIRKRHRFDLLFIPKLVAFLRKQRIQIVHAHEGCFFYGAVCSRLARVGAYLYSIHGQYGDVSTKNLLFDRLAGVLSDTIIAVSDDISRGFRARHPLFRKKTITVVNGVNTRRFRPLSDPTAIAAMKDKRRIPREKMVIGSVGRLEPVKDYGTLIHSFAELRKRSTQDMHLVFIGEGCEREGLEALSSELGLDKDISFLGMCHDIDAILPVFDVFVLSSLSEGTSVSLLEALACGIPAIVTTVGGNPDIVTDGHNGLLCRPGDVLDLRDKMATLVNRNQLRDTMGGNARESALTRFSLDAMMRKHEEIYTTILGWPFSEKPPCT